ncbi:ABC-2 type transport system ATP-binding protein [Enterococcus sp. AZ196]
MVIKNKAIEVKNLVKTFGEKRAVDKLSFTVEKGTIFGLLGHNGAGKSTTIDCILGTQNYDSANITLLGKRTKKALSICRCPISRISLSKSVESQRNL